jgi:hypothetical protein
MVDIFFNSNHHAYKNFGRLGSNERGKISPLVTPLLYMKKGYNEKNSNGAHNKKIRNP